VATSTVQAALGRAASALERGRGAEAVQILLPHHRSGSLPRDEELSVRARIAEAYLLQDDLTQAAAALGRPPDVSKEPLPDARLSTLWRLHGRLAFERTEQSRAIALHTRALKYAELAHDSRLIGLAHYELALCYKRVGDSGIVREHLTEASNALHAAGDKRHLALAHRLLGVLQGQEGRMQEAATSLQLAERIATQVRADDVLAGTAHNQAILALMAHRLDEALALAERGVALYRAALGEGHGLAITLATLGQVFVQIGDLDRAEEVLMRALEVRKPVQFHVTTGAVFDTLAQIHLMRGTYERASEYLRQAGEAYGGYGAQTGKWYEWSVKVLEIKLAIRRGAFDEAIARADDLVAAPDVPPADALQADLGACEALLELGRVAEAEQRLKTCESRFDPRTSPANWGEFLRVRGVLHWRRGHQALAYHDFAQSVNIFDLLGERYQTALAHLAVARLAAGTGARAAADRSLALATPVFQMLGAGRDLADVAAVRVALDSPSASTERAIELSADDAIVTRLADAAILPDLLARETVTTVQDITGLDTVVAFVAPRGSDPRLLDFRGCDRNDALALARAAADGAAERNGHALLVAPLDKATDGPRFCVATGGTPATDVQRGQFRLLTAVARQGFELCALRERPTKAAVQQAERTLEPLLPGFICASAAMARVADQIQRVQGQTLTVLITGESGTGKDLIARAIHAGSPRRTAAYLPFNCTTMTRDLASSQLFGHRRGSFTGAMTDQPGLIRSAVGGTLFLDEIGDVPLDVQPQLLRFLEQGEILPIGETRPLAVDVRVLAATNADLEQRVAEGKFREDLYYRLSVIRIEVPPLRARREEIPHLSTFFLREACDRLAKPEVTLSSATLDVFARYHWPGNVRQLFNEIQRAVAMTTAGSTIEPEHLSSDLSAQRLAGAVAATAAGGWAPEPGTLAENIEKVERTIITATLDKTGFNISETARLLGLTRKGLYMKMARLGLGAVSADTK
jgi:DNA-binding NtrC family response regulator/tetratricopeptide (TPR) repeat protein